MLSFMEREQVRRPWMNKPALANITVEHKALKWCRDRPLKLAPKPLCLIVIERLKVRYQMNTQRAHVTKCKRTGL